MRNADNYRSTRIDEYGNRISTDKYGRTTRYERSEINTNYNFYDDDTKDGYYREIKNRNICQEENKRREEREEREERDKDKLISRYNPSINVCLYSAKDNYRWEFLKDPKFYQKASRYRIIRINDYKLLIKLKSTNSRRDDRIEDESNDLGYEPDDVEEFIRAYNYYSTYRYFSPFDEEEKKQLEIQRQLDSVPPLRFKTAGGKNGVINK